MAQTTAEYTHEEWTFLDKSTRDHTHAVHLYPARMHPEIAKRIIRKYATSDTIVFDPFMGSGGVLLEGILAGHDAVGVDVSPLAVLLSKVKTTPIYRDLRPDLSGILKGVEADRMAGRRYPGLLPDMDIDSWFGRGAADGLSLLKRHVFSLHDPDARDFFKLCLSLTVRKASYQRNGAWKMHRMKDRAGFDPDPFVIFSKTAKAAVSMMESLARARPQGTAHPILGDTRDLRRSFRHMGGVLDGGRLNLVVTSPPYGDHHTTVAYGQFSRHPGLWLDMPPDALLAVDRVGLGGKIKGEMDDLDSATLEATLEAVRENDRRLTKNGKPCRTEEVYAFFHDLDSCMGQIASVLAEGESHCCFVVANRTVRRIGIPTDAIMVELGRKWGFRLEQVIRRHIPNKVMPLRNAPENITNNTGSTMTKEAVIIMRY